MADNTPRAAEDDRGPRGVITATAGAAPGGVVDEPSEPVCTEGAIRCLARVRVNRTRPGGAAVGPAHTRAHVYALPTGLGALDLAAAYAIDTSVDPGATIALVDSFGYPDLERDLAAYRSQFGLPPCTVASGCLRIVNSDGQSSPLPAPGTGGDAGWMLETALDVDMASAACPKCKLLVVQGGDLMVGNDSAVALGATVVSDSWGFTESAGSSVSGLETHFDHPGVAIFAGAGDSGYNDQGAGPFYPATSAHTIAVGGTALVRDPGPRGWAETAWADGGSACSLEVARPAYQAQSPCGFRASADVAAVGDPNTGVAVYEAASGGWVVVGGTSASSPLVAGIYAVTGHGGHTAAFAYDNPGRYYDVPSGTNGTCGTMLCNAGAGWDGPTGIGTPDAAALHASPPNPTGPTLSIDSPTDGATVDPGFAVDASADPTVTRIELQLDGEHLTDLAVPPFHYETSSALADGPHDVVLTAYDLAEHATTQQISVTVGSPQPGGDGGDHGGGDPGGSSSLVGGCAAGRGQAPSFVFALGLAGLVVGRRRRTAAPARRRA